MSSAFLELAFPQGGMFKSCENLMSEIASAKMKEPALVAA
jgi:hypothetical protein